MWEREADLPVLSRGPSSPPASRGAGPCLWRSSRSWTPCSPRLTWWPGTEHGSQPDHIEPNQHFKSTVFSVFSIFGTILFCNSKWSNVHVILKCRGGQIVNADSEDESKLLVNYSQLFETAHSWNVIQRLFVFFSKGQKRETSSPAIKTE